MSLNRVKKILAFLISSVASFALLALIYTLFNIKSYLPAAPIVEDIPYKEFTNYEINIAVTLTESNLVSLLFFDLNKEQVSIRSFPKKSITEDSQIILEDSPRSSLEVMIKTPIDRTITMSDDGLTSLVNSIGGIETNIKFSMPFSAAYGVRVTEGEQRITGAQLLMILNSTEKPDAQRLYYYSELMADLIKSLLSDFTKSEYYQLIRSGETDISYPDYYNYNTLLKNCVKNVTVLPTVGVWNGELFHLS